MIMWPLYKDRFKKLILFKKKQYLVTNTVFGYIFTKKYSKKYNTANVYTYIYNNFFL